MPSGYLLFQNQQIANEQNIFNLNGREDRSSRPDVFLGKGILNKCSKFTGHHPCRSAISIMFCIFIEITLREWVFAYKFAAYSQNIFY